MSTDFRCVYKIKSDRCKLLIHGYIKLIQKELFSDKNDNPFYDIPTLVIYICIWFYHQIDTFSICGVWHKLFCSSSQKFHFLEYNQI